MERIHLQKNSWSLTTVQSLRIATARHTVLDEIVATALLIVNAEKTMALTTDFLPCIFYVDGFQPE